MPRYHRVRFRVAPSDEELLAAWLWAEGSEGVAFEIDSASPASSIVVATFGEERRVPGRGDLPAWLSAVEILDSSAIEDRDWLAAWREAAGPIALGERLLVDPREWDAPREPVPADGRFVLEIPARTAFGVGSHESTRLAYELVEATDLAGKRLLDVGCGSGILAMAALALGARAAIGFDFDPAAALLAGQYARHNRNDAAFYLGTVAALAASRHPAFEVVVLNVLPHEIADELPLVVDLLAPGGELLVSGVLGVEAPAVIAAIERLGCRRTGTIEAGEWTGLRFEKRSDLATDVA